MGCSLRWKSTSPATLIEDAGSEVKAFAFLMTPEQIAQMDVFEGFPIRYDRKVVQLIDKEGQIFSAQVYLQTPKEDFTFPCDEYLDA